MIFYRVELFESIELFGICRQSSHGWAIIDAVRVHGGCVNLYHTAIVLRNITEFTIYSLFAELLAKNTF